MKPRYDEYIKTGDFVQGVTNKLPPSLTNVAPFRPFYQHFLKVWQSLYTLTSHKTAYFWLILSKIWKNVVGKLTHFCLGPKSWNGHWDPCFRLSFKIDVFGSKYFH